MLKLLYISLWNQAQEGERRTLTRLGAQVAAADQDRNISRVWIDDSRVGLRIGQAPCNRAFP
jgi:hypothetical protein